MKIWLSNMELNSTILTVCKMSYIAQLLVQCFLI